MIKLIAVIFAIPVLLAICVIAGKNSEDNYNRTFKKRKEGVDK